MGMEYYNLHSSTDQVFSDLTTTRAFVEKFFRDTSDLPDVRAMVVDRLEEVVAAKPSLRQLEAFLSDLCSIFCQEREEERPERKEAGYHRSWQTPLPRNQQGR